MLWSKLRYGEIGGTFSPGTWDIDVLMSDFAYGTGTLGNFAIKLEPSPSVLSTLK
jgi:hypothetical protein